MMVLQFMKVVGPISACVEQTRSVIEQTHDALKKYRRGIDASQEAVKRSKQIATECLLKARALKSAVIVK